MNELRGGKRRGKYEMADGRWSLAISGADEQPAGARSDAAVEVPQGGPSEQADASGDPDGDEGSDKGILGLAW